MLPLLGNPFIPDPGVTVNGILVEGTATAADVGGPLAGDLDASADYLRRAIRAASGWPSQALPLLRSP